MIVIGAFFSLFLITGAILATFPANAQPPHTIGHLASSGEHLQLPLNETVTPSDVLDLMLASHTRWDNLQIRYDAKFFGPGVPKGEEVFTHQFWLDSTGLSRVEIGSPVVGPLLTWMKNQDDMWTINYEDGTYYSEVIPKAFRSVENFGVPEAEIEGQPVVVPHPTGLLMPSWVTELIYPTSLAQSMSITDLSEDVLQSVQVIGTDQIAGRQSIVISRRIEGSGEPVVFYKLHKYWVDAATGVILQQEVIDPESGIVTTQVTAIEVQYNDFIPESTFIFVAPENMVEITPPVY
jgi:hypothetical protein